MNVLSKIIDFDVLSSTVTLQFEDGYSTRRSFYNRQNTLASRKCSLSGKTIKINEVYVHVSIKKRGYSRYFLSMDSINRSLTGELFTESRYVSEVHRHLELFMEECRTERKVLNDQDKDLRQALREIKFKNSKLGKKMSATVRLIELITENS